jgi:hypothetical protein
MFNEIKNRDAWSTIRGFVYQVDVTIKRWIELNEGDILELERGEDIDIVHKDINNKEASRELEQLKHRDSKISLNQDQTLEILLNFFIHKSNNPSQNLHFRFVTNASYATERPAIFPDGKKGINAWIDLYDSKEIKSEDDNYKAIKKHLIKKIQEKIDSGCTQQEANGKLNWKDFKEFLEKDENLTDFIKSFEWSGNFDDHENIAETVKTSLIEKYLVEDYKEATLAYSKLFLHVFKLLTHSGRKQLVWNELRSQISLSVFNEPDQRSLDTINALLTAINQRMTELENSININTDKIAQLTNDVNVIVQSDTVFDYKLRALSINPPVLIKNGSQRRKKIESLLDLFKSSPCIHIQGINGTGKSQLASQLCLKFECRWWLDLRSYGNDPQKTTIIIEAFFSLISNTTISNNKGNWIDEVANRLSNGAVIVLNDLPDLHDNQELIELFILILNKFHHKGVKLLTTSNYNIPSKLLQSIEPNFIHEYRDLDFSDDELVEFLINSGADNSTSNYISLITALSSRNASLVGAIVYRLKSLNWGTDSGVLLDTLLKREFSKETLEDAQQSIKTCIKDQTSRELLYRLSLINWQYRRKDVFAISEVEKSINHPNEKFLDLVNVWIQKISDETFLSSPIIYNLGEDNLPEDVIQNVHLAIAKSILSDKKLNQITASRCIASFIRGKDFNNAGFILLKLYRSATSIKEIEALKDWGFISYWEKLTIPKEMGVILRAYIRAEQIRLKGAIGKKTEHLYNDIESFIQEEGITVSQKTLLHFICVSQFDSAFTNDIWYHIEEIIANWKQLEEFFKGVINSEMFTGLLWIVCHNLETQSDIEKWINLISWVEDEFKINFFDNKIAQTAITFVNRRIINSDLNRNNNGDPEIVIKTLEFFAEYFNNRKYEVLEASIQKEIIFIKFQNNESERLYFSKKLIAKYSSLEAKYLIYENIGKLLYNKDITEESLPWLINAVETDCRNQINFPETLVYGASAISKSDSLKAVEYCELALKVVSEREDYLELYYIQILSELGVAYWLNKQNKQSLQTFEKVVNKLFDLKETQFDKKWIRLFSWVGHSLGYIASAVSRGRVPEKVADGGDYVKPYQGIFSFNTKDLSDLYDPAKDSIIYAHLALFSEGVGDISKAYEWSLRAFDLARRIGNQQLLLMISSACSQYSLINFKVEEAFEANLLFSAVSSHLTGTPEEKHQQLEEVDVKAIYKSKPSESWNVAEDTAVTFGCIPLFIMVLNSYIADKSEKSQYALSFFKTLIDYRENASNPELWSQLIEIGQKITNNTINVGELNDLGNKFGNQNRKNLQIICILGVIFLSKNGTDIITQIINIFPYLTKIYGNTTKSFIQFILTPFVKERAIVALKEEFVGSRQDLNSIIKRIESSAANEENTIQLILQPIVEELGLKIIENRKSWLYEYKQLD